jgi:hypothetical protein
MKPALKLVREGDVVAEVKVQLLDDAGSCLRSCRSTTQPS